MAYRAFMSHLIRACPGLIYQTDLELRLNSADLVVPDSIPAGGRIHLINSLTTKKQTTKLLSANFQTMLSPIYIILRIQRPESK